MPEIFPGQLEKIKDDYSGEKKSKHGFVKLVLSLYMCKAHFVKDWSL